MRWIRRRIAIYRHIYMCPVCHWSFSKPRRLQDHITEKHPLEDDE